MTAKIVDVTKTSEEYKDLPPTQRAFHVKHIGENGQEYADDFVIKRLNLGDMARCHSEGRTRRRDAGR